VESPYAKVLRDAAARRKKIAKLHNNGKGMSKSDLGRKFGISPQRVAAILEQERAK
jgi:hypothetical protein